MLGKMDGGGSKVQQQQQPDVRKSKKKQVKDEMDRIRQAEKKRRRLEKALATSAAIRAELEKKKQKKKEEQQRLDEEGAAIAEAVALHVLLGEEDSDDSRKNLNKNEGLMNNWGDKNLGSIFPYNGAVSRYWLDGIGWVSNTTNNHHRHQYGSHMGSTVGHPRYLDEECWNSNDNATGGISAAAAAAGLIAAQAVSSLRICEDNNEMDKYVLKPMSRC